MLNKGVSALQGRTGLVCARTQLTVVVLCFAENVVCRLLSLSPGRDDKSVIIAESAQPGINVGGRIVDDHLLNARVTTQERRSHLRYTLFPAVWLATKASDLRDLWASKTRFMTSTMC